VTKSNIKEVVSLLTRNIYPCLNYYSVTTLHTNSYKPIQTYTPTYQSCKHTYTLHTYPTLNTYPHTYTMPTKLQNPTYLPSKD